MKATVYVGTSVDGFIARDNGDVDFLDSAPSIDGEDYGYAAFMKTVDALVMGRATYDKVLSFGVAWPYQKPVIVLSRKKVAVPAELAGKLEWMSGTPAAIISALERRGVEHIYVDGGKTIQRFLDAGAVQRLIITRVPILIGQGIPLFGPLRKDVKLKHVETRTFPNGLVQSEYVVDRKRSSRTARTPRASRKVR